jgi:hypothetical protein
MNTNLEYEQANVAANLVRTGMNIIEATEVANANLQLVNIMMNNQELFTEDVFVDEDIRIQREAICICCDKNIKNTCMECACPLPTITNMKFKKCPLEKW